jgi:probable F420-dependent oxidoreductase
MPWLRSGAEARGGSAVQVDFASDAVLRDAATAAGDAEELGYRAVWFGETAHDPFLSVALAASATSRIEVGTGVAIAFARSPMTLAVTANDLQTVSQGRFVLGLGSQVKPHITRRFAMPWSHPAARMREFVLAMRAIWRCWHEGEPLDFQGEFYSHTLMTPFFNPGPNEYGPPQVFIAGVGDLMTGVVGEVADGFLCHGFTTERYLREVTLPALERGRKRAGLTLDGFQISGLPFVVTGRTEEQVAASTAAVKDQIAFYASTPVYRPVLECHGWGDLQQELTALTKTGRWSDMAGLIDDEMLQTFAIVADPDDVAAAVRQRYGDVFTRMHLYVKPALDPATMRPIIAELASS